MLNSSPLNTKAVNSTSTRYIWVEVFATAKANSAATVFSYKFATVIPDSENKAKATLSGLTTVFRHAFGDCDFFGKGILNRAVTVRHVNVDDIGSTVQGIAHLNRVSLHRTRTTSGDAKATAFSSLQAFGHAEAYGSAEAFAEMSAHVSLKYYTDTDVAKASIKSEAKASQIHGFKSSGAIRANLKVATFSSLTNRISEVKAIASNSANATGSSIRIRYLAAKEALNSAKVFTNEDNITGYVNPVGSSISYATSYATAHKIQDTSSDGVTGILASYTDALLVHRHAVPEAVLVTGNAKVNKTTPSIYFTISKSPVKAKASTSTLTYKIHRVSYPPIDGAKARLQAAGSHLKLNTHRYVESSKKAVATSTGSPYRYRDWGKGILEGNSFVDTLQERLIRFAYTTIAYNAKAKAILTEATRIRKLKGSDAIALLASYVEYKNVHTIYYHKVSVSKGNLEITTKTNKVNKIVLSLRGYANILSNLGMRPEKVNRIRPGFADYISSEGKGYLNEANAVINAHLLVNARHLMISDSRVPADRIMYP